MLYSMVAVYYVGNDKLHSAYAIYCIGQTRRYIAVNICRIQQLNRIQYSAQDRIIFHRIQSVIYDTRICSILYRLQCVIYRIQHHTRLLQRFLISEYITGAQVRILGSVQRRGGVKQQASPPHQPDSDHFIIKLLTRGPDHHFALTSLLRGGSTLPPLAISPYILRPTYEYLLFIVTEQSCEGLLRELYSKYSAGYSIDTLCTAQADSHTLCRSFLSRPKQDA